MIDYTILDDTKIKEQKTEFPFFDQSFIYGVWYHIGSFFLIIEMRRCSQLFMQATSNQ